MALVGRNGAGKTTTLTTLAGERLAHAGGRLSARPDGDRFELTATVPVRVPA